MATKRFKELKNLSKDELHAKVRELEGQIFQAKMQTVTRQLEDTSTVWKLRKDLARVKTLQTQTGVNATAASAAAASTAKKAAAESKKKSAKSAAAAR